MSTPEPVEVMLRGRLRRGPIGDRIAVFDYNRDRDVVFPPATPNADGSFPRYDVGDLRFHQLNAYAIAARAVELVERELGRPLRWGFDGSRLLVVPHAGLLQNAFYSSATHSLQFYSFLHDRGRAVYHTALAHDIVAHETGHAILDAVRPRFCEPFEPETAALHEAVGDLTAVFAAFSHEPIRRRAAGRLERVNLLSEIAEGFEQDGDAGWTSLRSLVNTTPAKWKNAVEAHDRSLQLSAAVYACLVRISDEVVRSGNGARSNGNGRARRMPSAASALETARNVLQRMCVRALDYLPPADATLADFAQAMLVADRYAEPEDERRYRAIVTAALVEAELVERGFSPKRHDDVWDDYPRSWPRLTARDAYLFLDVNRKRLALWPHALDRDFVVRDVQVKRPREGPGEVDQVVLVYEYPVDVELRGRAYGALEESWITLRGGGTLVFDAAGHLLHHAEKPVTRERIEDALAFIRGDTGASFAIVESSADDELRRTVARRPWFLEVSGQRVVMRVNHAVCCGRGCLRAPIDRAARGAAGAGTKKRRRSAARNGR